MLLRWVTLKIKLYQSDDWSILPIEIKNQFQLNNYFFEEVFFKGIFYYSTNDSGEIIAFCKANIAHWKIKRLPGKMGGILTKIIPFIPIINRLIRPNNHTFLVPEAVWIKEDNPQTLSFFFESILEQEKLNLLIWWVDVKESLFVKFKDKIQWGIVHRMIGNSSVNIVVKSNNFEFIQKEKSFYSAGMDSF